MEARHAIHLPKSHFPAEIVAIKTAPEDIVKRDSPLLIYQYNHTDEETNQTSLRRVELLSPYEGILETVHVHSGERITEPSHTVATICEPCSHAVQWHGQCGLCGKDLSIGNFSGSDTSRATINMAHDVLGLTVSHEEAARLEQDTATRLLASRKLSLIVDLDQTIIHATVDPTVGEWRSDSSNVNHEATRDIAQFTLPDSPTVYYIKLRPYTRAFLTEISKHYELHIYTMGTRNYASKVASVIDPDGTIFRERILSRDESGSMTQKTLQRLFPCDTSMVVVIDDRADVWGWSPNLIKVRPYDFFVGIGDINGMFLPKLDATPKHEEPPVEKISPEGSVHAPLEQEPEEEDEIDPESLQRQQLTHIRTMERQQKSRPLQKQQQRLPNQKPILVDNDDELKNLLAVLEEIHGLFYESKSITHRDVRHLVPELKHRVLNGVTIVFSSIIPLGSPQETSDIWRLAECFGAKCSTELTPEVTHVVAAKRGTAKVNTAKKKANISIVRLDWLTDSISRWKRQREEDYVLERTSATSSPTRPNGDATEAANQTIAEGSTLEVDDDLLRNSFEQDTQSEVGDAGIDNIDSPPTDDENADAIIQNMDWASALGEVDEFLDEDDDDDDDVDGENESYQDGSYGKSGDDEDEVDGDYGLGGDDDEEETDVMEGKAREADYIQYESGSEVGDKDEIQSRRIRPPRSSLRKPSPLSTQSTTTSAYTSATPSPIGSSTQSTQEPSSLEMANSNSHSKEVEPGTLDRLLRKQNQKRPRSPNIRSSSGSESDPLAVKKRKKQIPVDEGNGTAQKDTESDTDDEDFLNELVGEIDSD